MSVARLIEAAGKQRLLLHQRTRRHLAVLAVLLAVGVVGYQLLPQRTVQVQADGQAITFSTYHSNDVALLERSGVSLAPGDRLTLLDGGGIDVLRVERARRVLLEVDGTTYQILTHAVTIDQLLDEASVVITDRDSVLQNGSLVSMNAPVEPPVLFAVNNPFAEQPSRDIIEIAVRRAVPFTINVDGIEQLSSSSRPTIAQALREAGVRLGPGDDVRPAPQEPLEANARIEIRHARALTVTLPGDHQVLYTLAGTVGEALDDAGIVLPSDAFIDPPAESPVVDGMAVRVVQLSEGAEFEREYIESGTVYRSDPSLGPGQVRTVQGNDGVRVRRYAIAYVNGEEASRELIEEYWDPEPMDTVVYYPPQRGLEEAPPEGAQVTTLRVYATWYNPASAGRPPTDPAYGRTATGVLVTYGVVAVDPNIIPLGTRMYIPGYGYGVAADTGGAVKGYIIDLGYPDGVQVDWASRWLDIYILP